MKDLFLCLSQSYQKILLENTSFREETIVYEFIKNGIIIVQ